MVPDGWTPTQMGELAKFTSGGTPSKKNASFWGGSYPWISGKDLKQHYLTSSIDTLSEEGFQAAKTAPAGSTLILVRGMTLLKDFPVGYAMKNMSFNQDIKALIPHSTTDGLFLSFLLAGNKHLIKQLVSTAGHGTGRLDTNSIQEFSINLPPLPEQNKIAKILSTWDKAITTTEQLLANSQKQKKSLMQKLLAGKKRLPGFDGEWNYKSIKEIATRIQRKSDENNHPILTISSLSRFVRQDEKFNRYMAGESVKNYILLKRGEFAYNKGNSKTYEFGCIFDLEGYETGLVPHVYVCFKLMKSLSHRYFKYLFESDYLKPQLGRLVNTGVRNNGLLNIKPSEFMNTNIPVPNYEEQEKIADLLHTSTMEITTLQQKLAFLKQEKKALMQQLLTGKRRVKVN